MKQYLLWWVMFIVLIAGLVVGYQLNGADYLAAHDHTYISFVSLGFLVVVTTWLGVKFHLVVNNKIPHFSLRYFHFVARLFPGIGLVGTIVGFIIVFSSGGNDTQALYDQLVNGAATAFFATLIGIASGYFVELQAMLVEEFYEKQPRTNFVP